VLIAGGWNGSALASAEVFNPGTGAFSSVANMTVQRTGHFAVKLNSGLILVGAGMDGSASLNSAEVFDPFANVFTRIANLPSARVSAQAILLSDGRVMITGGASSGNNLVPNVEFYTPQQ